MKLPSPLRFLQVALAGSLALSAQAQVITTTSSLNDGSIFAVSNSDLFQTNLASVTASGGFSGFANNSLALLTNGSFGGANTDGASSVAPFAGTTLTFNFNLSVNTLGYTLTNLRTYVGWDSGRDGQEYSVAYSTVAAPSSFTLLASVPQFNPAGVPFANAHTLVSLTDGSGVLASGVASVRFTFTGFENGGTAYREFDAFGSATGAVTPPTPGLTAVPEPSTYGLMGVALLGGIIVLKRRRAKAAALAV
jgi:PEP-CTERM motif